MPRAERIVGRFLALGEAREAVLLADAEHPVAPPGEDLVRISLVADVPDQTVLRRVEDIVQRDGQLDHAEPRTEMAAGDRHGFDHRGAHVPRQRLKLVLGQAAQGCGVGHRIENRGFVRRGLGQPLVSVLRGRHLRRSTT